MNTPDTEWEANMQVETLHSILADISSFEPDGEVYTLVEQAHTELAKLRTIILSRDTYWKEKVRKDEQGWEGYVVVDPQSNNYKCSPIFFSVKEAEKWRRDFGEPALKVETVDIILKTKHE